MDAVLLLPLGLVLLNVYALALVLLRAPAYRTRVYRPMVLNIGLSVAPAAVMLVTFLAVLVVVQAFPSPVALFAVLAVGGVVWLLLLPNAAYLVTELNLSHRREGEAVPLWYDIVLVITLAMSGVLNTLANVALAQLVVAAVLYPEDDRPLARAGSWVAAAVILLLVAFGMYLGRYIRFNSWDLLHPGSFLRKLVGHFRDGAHLRAAAGFVVTHGLFLAILYTIVIAPAVVGVVER
ncbi:DUF1361 domain-containing protein [Xylanimonas oleitrophica]|uniref:DUF1361 domain-containing protein n=1 Tax=Xylanimonas oleitrophica TaxID=2607479 RepID=A0A2W5WRJ0_9MICO|nr:DUF1361 domain-containing protein [Xylanimonas oleitrophica]PZR53512.1 DUF1361 domain-containing protein [Xylanimonas oleitrophica]